MLPNTILIVGHRGTGKTTLLLRLKKYFPDQKFADLDEEIQKSSGLSIPEIFKRYGEIYFRNLELSVLKQLLESPINWISLGAGIDLQKVKAEFPNCNILWLCRESDSQGRIFLDRPSLEPNISPLLEYEMRYKARNQNFLKLSTWIYEVPEGLQEFCEFEKKLLSGEGDFSSASITVLPNLINQFDNRRQNLFSTNFKFIEVRNDLPAAEVSSEYSAQLLFSIRNQEPPPFENPPCDWALELGAPKMKVDILSSHDRLDEISLIEVIQNLERHSSLASHLKLSPVVYNLNEIIQGIEWQQKDCENRSFLPRSCDGRWQWVRLFLKGKQKINFVRQGVGTALDQPTMWQWLATPHRPLSFAAVLGSPVKFSFSPAFHSKFFAKIGIPFWAIDLSVVEWKSGIEILKQMGLVAAAVTSPLKSEAGGNTLLLENFDYKVFNTDSSGLKGALAELQLNSPDLPVLVWGSGGVSGAIKEVFPQADFYSQRTGQRLDKEGKDHQDLAQEYGILIWAGLPNGNKPPNEIRFKGIFDLNYRENSVARDLALERQVPYFSGLKMFEIQGKEQQKLWQILSAID
jgi:shikimate kinase/shikimate 5-dehydrogenase